VLEELCTTVVVAGLYIFIKDRINENQKWGLEPCSWENTRKKSLLCHTTVYLVSIKDF